MKPLLIAFFCFTSLHAEPFRGIILANSSAHGGTGKLEYLTNGERLLIRPSGEGFKRASGLVDLTTNHYTHLQHHNHTYTEIGDLAKWPMLMAAPERPLPKMREKAKITPTQETKEIQGKSASLTKVALSRQEMEIWGLSTPAESMPPFYQWHAFCPEPRPRLRLEEQIDEICRSQNIFPLLITLKSGENTKTLWEVTAITPAKPGDTSNPALDAKTYAIPGDHRLMLHPLQERQRSDPPKP